MKKFFFAYGFLLIIILLAFSIIKQSKKDEPTLKAQVFQFVNFILEDDCQEAEKFVYRDSPGREDVNSASENTRQDVNAVSQEFCNGMKEKINAAEKIDVLSGKVVENEGEFIVPVKVYKGKEVLNINVYLKEVDGKYLVSNWN